jgi:Mlc titration factor MtfA (ptsG expression regulator)
MKNIEYSISIPEFIVFSILTIGYIYFRIRYSDNPFIKKNLKRFLFLRKLENAYKPYLSQYFSLYNSLNPQDKLVFERRVQRFIDIKQFIPRGGIKEITPEMKALVAGSAVQLTYGYPNIYFKHFWRILIYPDNYYSTITHKHHKGEVNLRGLIVLSWKSFKEGFSNQTDGLNLGLHEMAHALRLINIVENEEYDFYDREIMNEFDNEAKHETIKLINSPHEKSIFRNYSTTNLDEFFSVAIECFFERSYEFKQYNPKLYTLLTKILKIDPNQLYSESYIKSMAS